MKIPMRKQWSLWELKRAENREIIGYFGGDFHNLYAVKCLNQKATSLMQRFTVKWRTNDVLVDAPLWHPKRKLMAEIKKLASEANERRRKKRTEYLALKKPFTI